MIRNKLVISGDEKFLQACYSTLSPEEGEGTSRADYKLKLGRRNLVKNETVLTVTVTGKDYVAFRAIMTSVLNVLAVERFLILSLSSTLSNSTSSTAMISLLAQSLLNWLLKSSFLL